MGTRRKDFCIRGLKREELVIAKLLKPGDRSFTAEQVRLIGADGEQLDIVTLTRARDLALQAGLDLVLVSDRANPPVVRIMDYGKLLFEQKKNLKNQRKNNVAQKVKEVKFHINIDKHDYEYKLARGVEFLGKGCKLKVTLMLRGREMAHQDLAFELMDKVMAYLAEYGEADGKPKLLGRNITVFFAPGKKSGRAAEAGRHLPPREDNEQPETDESDSEE